MFDINRNGEDLENSKFFKKDRDYNLSESPVTLLKSLKITESSIIGKEDRGFQDKKIQREHPKKIRPKIEILNNESEINDELT